MSVNAVTIEIIKGALRSAQAECEALLERTAMSPVIREKQDYFIGFYGADGRLVTGTKLPLFGDVLRPILDRFPAAEIRPGDIFWYNDCYASRGGVSHTSDQVFATPVFVDGDLVAFAQSWAHFRDIGGAWPGSNTPGTESIFQEGIIVPPVRLYREGELNTDLFETFVRNSRFPQHARGDTRALTAAVRLGEKRLGELFARFGTEVFLGAVEAMIDQSSRVFRRRLAELFPPGHSWRFADRVDGDGKGGGPFTVRFTLESREDGFTLDTTESDAQAKGPINFLMNPTVPNTVFGLYLLRDEPGLMMNEGLLRAISDVRTKDGTIIQPAFPAPLGQRSNTLARVISSCLGLIAQATEGESPAASSIYTIYTLTGRQPSDGSLFYKSGGHGTGQGARPFADGLDVIYYVAQQNYPIEFLETDMPVRIRTYAIRADSGGPGRWRGGCGMVREMEVLVDGAVLNTRMDNVENPPWGVKGGESGRPGRFLLNPGTPGERELPRLAQGIPVQRGDVVRMESTGGGGWGHPFDREAWRVRQDVRGGFVSVEAARADYGVVLRDGPDREVDEDATAALRAQRADNTALFHRHGTHRDAKAWWQAMAG
ncbi:hydantoinase B/oxoprolinase family protein [Roseomonas frigidaquae]|uniref:Hydantoinase B/oxoprolinase family protein n=1 Tax=Falsiroseomonas frigidaquae TaxID=487318 RepID=A0ABX1EWK7_9PROT|nr:hydantoinase B/oxoprolinase family protein [Falsiroseomonas frigidaquae]NKE44107.1 hydantoinase B/oxoprolinase family protein [Falsiroseomonas frigidaquae]